jgi:hypothetical protein
MRGERTVARVPTAYGGGIRALLGTERHPIGATGNVMPGADGLLDWPFA